MTVSDILIDEEDKCVVLSNYIDSTMDIPDINRIIDVLNNYKDYKIKIDVKNNSLKTIYNEYMISYFIRVNNLTHCVKAFTLKVNEFKI